ncbi:Glycosyltransferase involved in cell wall bisynthesis [Butyrivibrio proteoclasticus]|uniref:Glycosyltransferase involved in cell wall bisynthesis n=1 Tax=Butyrivibrio proteoclasticus TaxID=43305 RepID=A0A1I5PW23_9FIRM|nr:glycosyltransferase [Butyrivibrio proteoclasticus]SFP38164.1 Glycosyltransferase involved in cell wall bisynthesis [Butyrivibrio proteoclasticus]
MKNKIENSTPIRIAYIIGKMWAGGVEAVVFNYYRAIDHNKFQFDFYYDADSTVEPPQELIDMGARFIKLPPYQQLNEYIKQLRVFLRTEKYTIVHSHLNTLSVFPLYAAWREHVPIRIAHNHSVPGGNEFKRNAAKQLLRCFAKLFSTHYFACSEKAGRWMFGDKDFDAGRVYVLKNAVEFEKFRVSDAEVGQLRKDLKVDGKFVVGHIGRFTYAKNHQFLLDVFREVLNRRNDAVLLLVGDGELHEEIEEGIIRRGLEKHVVMVGKVTNPEKYYRVNDVLIIPSVFEGLSMTTIESQVSGVPVVISKAIPREAVISNGCRYMDMDTSPDKWAEVAIAVADMDVQLTKSADNYNIKTQVPKLETWYLNAIRMQYQSNI